MMKYIFFVLIGGLFVSSCFGLFDPANMDPNEVVVFKVRYEGNRYGDIAVHLYPNEAPVTSHNFREYVESGFYDGIIFHRVHPSFVLQAGLCDAGLNYREPNDPIVNENPNGLSNTQGTLSMARTNDPDSATSQFFVNTVDNLFLDWSSDSSPGYCVFAEIIDGMGMDVVADINNVAVFDTYSDDPDISYKLENVPMTPAVIREAGFLKDIGYCAEYPVQDINKDCTVDSYDYYLFSQAWISDGFGPYGVTSPENWDEIYDEALGDDVVHDMVMDAQGNVYVTGESKHATENVNIVTSKYDAAGTLLWSEPFNNDQNGIDKAYAMTMDGQGNIYVVGYSRRVNNDFVTIKYDPNGVQEWAKYYNGPDNNHDIAYGVAADQAGGVYVTGRSLGNSTNYDYATVKYSSDGDQLWAKRYNSSTYSTADEWPAAITVDDANNVYVTGRSQGFGTGYDVATVKYNEQGTQLWAKRMDGDAHKNDSVYAIAAGPDYLVLAWAVGNAGGGTDYTVTRISQADGSKQWQQVARENSPYFDKAQDVVIDAAGYIYTAGQVYETDTGMDICVAKYDKFGYEFWLDTYNHSGSSYDEATALCVDGMNYIAVAGHCADPNNKDDVVVLKYAPDGRRAGVAVYNNAAANDDDHANAVAVDADGNVCVAGSTKNGIYRNDYLVVQFPPDDYCNANPDADLDENCQIDAADICIFAQEWLQDYLETY